MSAAFEPAPLRPRRRLDPGLLAVAAVAVLVAAAWLKPWASAEPGGSRVHRAAGSEVPSVEPAATASGISFENLILALGSTNPSSPPPSYGPLTDAQRRAKLVDRIVGWLAPEAGTWGVGSGGWAGTLGDPASEASLMSSLWSSWIAAHPNGAPAPLARAARSCTAAPRVPAAPYVIAVTVPMGVTPDWRVAAVRRVGGRNEDLASVLRQVSPPGNRGIAYLFRADDRPWPSGFYRFRILGPVETVAIDACVATK